MLKAFYGDAATPENDFGYGWLPKLEHESLAAMARLGTVVRFSKKLAIGI